MKRMTGPPASETSLRTALSRSSNSPRYLAPAISAPMSSAMTRRSRSDSGTSPETMRWARPSTIAVLPTPGSPISTGLFFVRRDRTWMTRRISSSRPMTGSSLPCSAASVRSRPNFSSAWYLSSGFWSVTRCEPRTSASASRSASLVGARAAQRVAGRRPGPASDRSRCSVETNSSDSSRILLLGARAGPGRARWRARPTLGALAQHGQPVERGVERPRRLTRRRPRAWPARATTTPPPARAARRAGARASPAGCGAARRACRRPGWPPGP